MPRVPAWRFVVLLDEVLERGVPVPRVRRLEEGPNGKPVSVAPPVFRSFFLFDFEDFEDFEVLPTFFRFDSDCRRVR